jgi:hypothetical protein
VPGSRRYTIDRERGAPADLLEALEAWSADQMQQAA